MRSLYERAEELLGLDRALTDSVGGYGSAVLIQGDAGIGKSSLLAASAERATELGMTVLRAEASITETGRPYAVARSLLRGAGRDPFRVVPEGAAPSPIPVAPITLGATDRYAVEERILDALDEIVTAGPVLLAIDDLHWVDESTSAIIHALSRQIPSRPALLLLAGRRPVTGTAYEALSAALLHGGAACIRIGPLSTAAVLELAAQRLGTSPSGPLIGALERASGNPFFVNAILDHITRSAPEGGTPAVAEGVIDLSLRDSILGSVISTTAGGPEVLRHAAVLGGSFTLSYLAAMLGDEPLETWNRLGPAIQAGLVDDRGDQLAFRHDLVREALYADIPGPLRAELHHKAAEALAVTGAAATVVASHLVVGPARRDLWAARWLMRAGAEASGVAPATASGFLQRALALCPPKTAEHDEIARHLVMNLVWSANLAEAERMALTFRKDAVDAATTGTFLMAVGWAYWVTGRTNEAARLLEEGQADASLPDRDRARLAALGSWVNGFQLGRPAHARQLAARALSGAADEVAILMAQCTLTGLKYLEGHPREAAEEAARLVALGAAGSAPELRQMGTNILLVLALIDSDLIAQADAAIAEGARISRQAGSASIAAIWHRTRALRHYAVGDWDDALAELAALRELTGHSGPQLGSTAGAAIGALIALHRGEMEQARTLLTDLAPVGHGPEFRGHWVEWARASYLEAEGKTSDALETLTSLWRRCEESGPALDLPWIGPHIARLAASCGAEAAAAPVATALDRIAESGPPSFQAAALHARGIGQRDPGLLIEAASLYRPGRRRFSEAMALLDGAVILVDCGRTAEAVEVLDAATEHFRDLGAVPALRQAAAITDRVGTRGGQSGRRPRPVEGWQSLTPSEVKVARLVADGLSNPEIADRLFISRRTVESHVARILQKLAVRSRTQVVRAVLDADSPT